MRLMSFSMTTPQFVARTKTVTRRLGWWKLKPGDVLMGVEKAQGLKRGEKVRRLHAIRIVSVRAEPIWWIKPKECDKEGFPNLTPQDFLEMFCRANRCHAGTTVNRIEFEHLE